MLHTVCMKHFFNQNYKWKLYKQRFAVYFWLTVGAFLMALAVTVYFDRLELVTGGVTGLAIILRHLFHIPMWLVNVATNIPIFIIGYRVLGRRSFYRTLYTTVCLSLFLGVMPMFPILTGDMLVDSLTGGVWMGIGLGMIFLQNASSGGADMLASIFNKRVQHISIPKLLAVLDGLVIVAGIGVFGIRNGIYALFVLFVITKVSDAVLEGPNHAKLMYVITSEYAELTAYITRELDRGVTCISAEGGYTGETRPMLMCALDSKEMVNVKRKIYELDANAICFVGDIREAYGEGFTKYIGV